VKITDGFEFLQATQKKIVKAIEYIAGYLKENCKEV